MLDEKRKNNLKIIFIILLVTISISALGYSFGLVSLNQIVSTPNYLSVSDISFGLTDSVANVSLGEVIPVLDKFGLTNESFSFSITNNGDTDQNYVVRLVDSMSSTISNTNIRYQIIKNDEEVGVFSLDGNGVIDSGTLKANEVNTYSFKVWLSYTSNQTNGTWSKVISVEAGSVNLDNSGANSPVLADGMIPVFYDNNINEWKKADENNSDIRYRWYDYDGQAWANAVTVNESVRVSYLMSPKGTVIPMDDINTMWVWIPRYKYTIFNKDGNLIDPVGINVIFEQGTKTTGSVTCTDEFDATNNTSEMCTDLVNGSIFNNVSTYTHPAFTFGNEELTGFWVAKFEASKNPSQPNVEIYIKPNMNTLSLSNNVMTYQNYFRQMELENNPYGFRGNGTVVNSDGSIDNDNNNIDIHMMKNDEWGAAAYLYHSNYGKYGNPNYVNNDKEVYINNNIISSTAFTGKSSGKTITSGSSNTNYSYNDIDFGIGASTTGNIYGIYDMSGGRKEIVMMNTETALGTFTPGGTGFTSPYPLAKYYSTYYSSNKYSIYKLGDATKETRGWYSDYISNNLGDNIFYRGGSAENKNGLNGIFNLDYDGNSVSSNYYSSRPVLKVTNDIYIEW